MNWLGDLIQKEIRESDSVLDLGCGIMQATMNFILAYPNTKIKCRLLHGVEIYDPYIKFLRDRNITVIKWDLRNIPLPFKPCSYNVVLLIDVLEHLDDLKQVEYLLNESSTISINKVIVFTPAYFTYNLNGLSAYGLGINELQRHKLLITKEFLEYHDFNVRYTIKGYKKSYYAIRKHKEGFYYENA